jgi:predicted DNA-binding transcriptional regulator YafY
MIRATTGDENMQILILAFPLIAAACVYVVRRGRRATPTPSKVAAARVAPGERGARSTAPSMLTIELVTAPHGGEARAPELSTIAEKINLPLTIRYRDRNGVETERPVTAMKVVGRIGDDGAAVPILFYAFCEKRNGVRAFRFERVVEAIDGETGEVVSDLANHLIQSAPAGATADPGRVTRKPDRRDHAACPSGAGVPVSSGG